MARYIEREKVFEQIAEAIAPYGVSQRCRDDIIYAVARISAADVRPERHGTWVDDTSPDCAVCSNCKERFYSYDNEIIRFRYCPNCGAKMDGKEQSPNG